MNYYEKHVFFCTNQRTNGKASCGDHGASELRAYAKERTKALGVAGAGRVRVNIAGCMGRCEEGPVMVVYPEGVWYTYEDQTDIDEIVEEHLVRGEIVETLRI